MEKVVIYCRVSTFDQSPDNQLIFLKKIVEDKKWCLVDTYVDHGISGGKGRLHRPEFDRLWKDMLDNKFNRILVWDVSRLGRSLRDLVEFLNDVNSVNCNLYIHQSGLDTGTPTGKMMFQMIGVFSEFEREMISERVKLGLQRVKSEGKILGRPKSISNELRSKTWGLINQGKSYSYISKELDISRMSVSRIKNEMSI